MIKENGSLHQYVSTMILNIFRKMFSENFFQIQQFYKSSNFKVKVNKFVLSNLIEVSTEQKKNLSLLIS